MNELATMPDIDYRAIAQRVSRARSNLIINNPFFGTLALRLDMIGNETHPMLATCGTIAVDGKLLVYNPRYIDTITDDVLRGLIAHQVMHCAMNHHQRRGARDFTLWQDACDFAVNPILQDAGFTLPGDALVDRSFKGAAAEEIYRRIQQEQPPSPESGQGSGGQGDSDQDDSQSQQQADGQDSDGQGDGGDGQPEQAKADDDGNATSQEQSGQSGSGGPGQGDPGPDEQPFNSMGCVADASADIDTDEWTVAREQAAQIHNKRCGDMPGLLQEFIEAERAEKIDWREMFAQFMQKRNKSDYRWTPPNRRHVHQGLYLPSLQGETIGDVVVAIDTSGSVTQDELNDFAGELESIRETVTPDSILVIYADTKVRGTETFSAHEPIQLTVKGRGGTKFKPTFNWIAKNDIDPVCLVYMTDLCSTDLAKLKEPDYPVLWIQTVDQDDEENVMYADDLAALVPFGELTRYSND